MKYKYILAVIAFLISNASYSQALTSKNTPTFVATEGDILYIRLQNLNKQSFTIPWSNPSLLHYRLVTKETLTAAMTNVIRVDTVDNMMYGLSLNSSLFETLDYNSAPSTKKYLKGYPRVQKTTDYPFNNWRKNLAIVSVSASPAVQLPAIGTDTFHNNGTSIIDSGFCFSTKEIATLALNNSALGDGSKPRYVYINQYNNNMPNAFIMTYRVVVLPKVNLNVIRTVNGQILNHDTVCQGATIKYTADITRKTDLGANTKPFIVTWYINDNPIKSTTYSAVGSNLLDTFSCTPNNLDKVHCSVSQDFQVYREEYSVTHQGANTIIDDHIEYYTYRAYTRSKLDTIIVGNTNLMADLKGACLKEVKFELISDTLSYSTTPSWQHFSTASYFKNGQPISSPYNNSTWNAGDVIKAILSSNTCPAYNNREVSITVPSYEVVTVTPSESIVNNNTVVTFTASATNLLNNNINVLDYSWYINGQSAPVGSSPVVNMLAGLSFHNGDVITCEARVFDMSNPAQNPVHSCFIQGNNVTMTVNGETSIRGVGNDVIKVYPNPFTNEIVIESNLRYQNASIYNMIGQCVLKTKDRKIDTRNLPNGIYVLKLDNGYTKKIIK